MLDIGIDQKSLEYKSKIIIANNGVDWKPFKGKIGWKNKKKEETDETKKRDKLKKRKRSVSQRSRKKNKGWQLTPNVSNMTVDCNSGDVNINRS